VQPSAVGGELAGWWYRAGASVIDTVVMVIPAILLFVAFRGSRFAAGILIDLVFVAYASFTIANGGQTLGNKAMGTRVVDASTGGPVSVGKAFGRSVSQVVMLIVIIIPWILDLLWPLWDSQNQTLHDKIAGTVVLRT
jgi:uncharacterized RDD family membrane protein YckC